MELVVEENYVITICYDLKDGNAEGELMERMDHAYPFTFLFGTGALLPSFENNLRGLKESDSFDFVLKCEEAYGPISPENIIQFPISAFEVDGVIPPNVLELDNTIAMSDADGNQFNGVVKEFNEETASIDFNHAMAGKDLHFSGQIMRIRKATVDELIRKHHIEEDGVRNLDDLV